MNSGGSRKTTSSAYANIGGSRKQIFPYDAVTKYQFTYRIYPINNWTYSEEYCDGETVGDGTLLSNMYSSYSFSSSNGTFTLSGSVNVYSLEENENGIRNFGRMLWCKEYTNSSGTVSGDNFGYYLLGGTYSHVDRGLIVSKVVYRKPVSYSSSYQTITLGYKPGSYNYGTNVDGGTYDPWNYGNPEGDIYQTDKVQLDSSGYYYFNWTCASYDSSYVYFKAYSGYRYQLVS